MKVKITVSYEMDLDLNDYADGFAEAKERIEDLDIEDVMIHTIYAFTDDEPSLMVLVEEVK